MKRDGWTEVDQELPDPGVLCIAFFPMGEIRQMTDDCVRIIGPTATAYFDKTIGGWIYADEPTPLRFNPTHWRAIGEL